VIDAVVHAVAGEDEIGFYFFEGAIKAFVDIWPGERVSGLRESGDALARESEIDELEAVRVEAFAEESGLDHGDIVAGVRDGVAEEKDVALEGCRDCRDGGVLRDSGSGEAGEMK